MWDGTSFLNAYRGAHVRRRKEAVCLFRALNLSAVELIEFYQVLSQDQSNVARLLTKAVRTRIKKQWRELSWQEWFTHCLTFDLSSWIGRCSCSNFFASLGPKVSFEAWYERWTYAITRPSRHPHQYDSAPPLLLRRLLAGLLKTAKTLKDWRRTYEAPEDYRSTSYPTYQIGADNTRREAWKHLRNFLP